MAKITKYMDKFKKKIYRPIFRNNIWTNFQKTRSNSTLDAITGSFRIFKSFLNKKKTFFTLGGVKIGLYNFFSSKTWSKMA